MCCQGSRAWGFVMRKAPSHGRCRPAPCARRPRSALRSALQQCLPAGRKWLVPNTVQNRRCAGCRLLSNTVYQRPKRGRIQTLFKSAAANQHPPCTRTLKHRSTDPHLVAHTPHPGAHWKRAPSAVRPRRAVHHQHRDAGARCRGPGLRRRCRWTEHHLEDPQEQGSRTPLRSRRQHRERPRRPEQGRLRPRRRPTAGGRHRIPRDVRGRDPVRQSGGSARPGGHHRIGEREFPGHFAGLPRNHGRGRRPGTVGCYSNPGRLRPAASPRAEPDGHRPLAAGDPTRRTGDPGYRRPQNPTAGSS